MKPTNQFHIYRNGIILTSAIILYTLSFAWLFRLVGDATGIFSLIPVALAGFFYGRKLGVLTGVTLFPLHLILYSHAMNTNISALFPYMIPPIIMTLLIGAFSGWLSELLIRNKNQLKILEEEHKRVIDEVEEREKIEEMLRIRELEYRTLVEDIKEIVFRTNVDGSWTFLNRSWEEVTGFTIEESIGTPCLNYIHPDDQRRSAELFKPLIDGTQTYCRHEIRYRKKNGDYCWVEIYARLIKDDSGNVLGTAGTLMDITQRKETENMLRSMNDTLEQHVKARTLQLENDIQQRKQVEEELQYQFTTERLFSKISAKFIDISVLELDSEIIKTLQTIVEFTKIDRALVFQTSEDIETISITHEWCAEGINGLSQYFQNNPISIFPWLSKEVLKYGLISHDSIAQLPEEASVEKEFFEKSGVKSFIIVPLRYHAGLIGSLVFETLCDYKTWNNKEIYLFQSVAEIFANAIIHKRMDKEIRESHYRLHEVLAASGCFVYSCKVTKGFPFTFISDNIKSILGYSSAEVLTTQHLGINNIHTDDMSLWFSSMLQVLKKGEVQIEYRLRHKNGSYHWLYNHIKLLRDENGKIIEIIGTALDITERKVAEEVLREREELLHSVLESIPQYVFWKDQNSIYLGCNERYARLSGFNSSKEIIGKSDYDLPKTKETADSARHHDQIIIATGVAELRYIDFLQMLNGKSMQTETTKVPLHDVRGNTIGVLGTFDDITDRIKAEKALLKSEELYRLMFQGNPNPMWVYDLETLAILTVNNAAVDHYGYSRDEFASMTIKDIRPKEDIPLLLHNIETVHDEYQKNFASRHKKKNGVIIEVEISSHSILFNGKNARLVLVNDTTERKILEKQFLRAQRMESIGTLAGGIAHDLNNILTPIMMWLEVLKEKLPDKKSQNLITLIESSTQRGSDMVRQVLTFARGIEGNRVELQPVHVLKEIKKILTESFPKSIEIFFDYPHEQLSVIGDATQLHQVLLNLCVNARDAMPNGGKINITCENVELDDLYARTHIDAKAGEYVLISVADTGTGIPPHIIDRIFDPFFSTKEVGKGTGLGLSTSLAIVKGHGGFINVYSEYNRGTDFKIYLPMVKPSEGSSQSKIQKNEIIHGNGELILIVDDETVIREIMKEILPRYGYSVITACDGTEAVAQYVQYQSEIQLVITDMMMPFMDGVATTRALRQINPNLKIIGMSGFAANETVLQGAKLQIQGFVKKPFTSKGLLEMISSILAADEIKVETPSSDMPITTQHLNEMTH